MLSCTDIPAIRARRQLWSRADETVALVPTMGFLHAGHMALIGRARQLCDRVVVSIFVNPSQFGSTRDLDAYPRDDARDLAMLEQAGVDAVFMPDAGEIYPPGDETIVETTRMANILHGQVRPGHFRGVTTVVARLFNIVGADVAVFGEKDYQQLQIIRRMVRDLHMRVQIHAVATVREADGLALSSRNVNLGPEDRAAAPVLYRALQVAEKAAAAGTTIKALRAAITRTITIEPRATLRAVDIVTARTLEPVRGALSGATAIMLSAEFGGILLIDQKVVFP